jgi:hypothetical protein
MGPKAFLLIEKLSEEFDKFAAAAEATVAVVEEEEEAPQQAPPPPPPPPASPKNIGTTSSLFTVYAASCGTFTRQ